MNIKNWLAVFFVGVIAAPALAQTGAVPLPMTMAPEGPPTFDETFQSLDAGTDQAKPKVPHRWRTVLGPGGALSADNRSFNPATLFMDPAFAGIAGGAPGPKPLGIQPLKIGGYGLAITATRAAPSVLPLLQGRTWTSGVLTTKFSFSQLHGYFEMRANLPTCVKGAWPAFWLLPISTPYWPVNGEIDAPETIGDGKIYWSTHSSAEKSVTQATPGSCTRGYHRYGVLWRADQIGFYYDRMLVASKATPADYQTPMFILIDLVMEGSWPGAADPTTKQVQMFVSNVTAWQAK